MVRLVNIPDSYLNSFRNGKEEGFAYYFQLYHQAVCYFARRYVQDAAVAEDLVEDAFINVWNKREQLDSECGLKNYLYKTVYHACLRWLERRQTRDNGLAQLALLSEQEEPDCCEMIIKAETLRLLREAMERLPEQCRQVFLKLYVEGKTVQETAVELRVTESTVYNQKARGVKLLRGRLGRSL